MVEEVKKEKKRKVLVTGSSGMLGSALCRRLSDAYDVSGLDVRRGDFFPTEQCDITNRAATVDAITHIRPDVLIHAAAWTNVDKCEADPVRVRKINIDGTENVALGAGRVNATLFYVSTDFVFDGKSKAPYREEDVPFPLSVYARSKLEGEKKVKALKNYFILRTSWLFGSNGDNFVDKILGAARREKELRVVDDQVGSPTYSEDLALAISKLLEVTLGGTKNVPRVMAETYHVTNSGQVSWFDYAKKILEIAGITNVGLTPINSRQLGRPAKRPVFSVMDNTKFVKATGFRMRPWQDALAEYITGKNGK